MPRIRFWVVLGFVGTVTLFVPVAQSQPTPGKAKPVPKPEPVAETKLIMEGFAGANLRGLAKLLREKPADAEAWAFARGQALLIAETGNLLLLRPPKTAANQEPWMTHAGGLRDAATNLARQTAAKDYGKSRVALAGVANACNRCHQAFRVGFRADPFLVE